MAKCVGVCTTNYLSDEIAANKYASSENATYPAANVYNLNRRKKVWRTSGHFDVVPASNTIVFRETTGVDLTATLTAGDYASSTAFLAELKAALEAAGASTYTCEITTAGFIKITSNLAGGGNIFQLMWTNGASAGMAAVMGFDTSANSTGAGNYTADVLRIHTDEWLKWDLAFPTNPKAFCITGDRETPIKVTPSATIKLQANSTDNWSAPELDLTIPYAEYSFAKWDFDGLAGAASSGYRYWRMQIVDKSNTRKYIEFGAVYLGDVHDATRGCIVFPLQYTNVDRSVIVVAEAGQAYAQENPKTVEFNLQWKGLKKEEFESLSNHWEEVGLSQSFFLILDAEEAFSTQKENAVYLVKFAQEPSSQLLSPNNFESSWRIRGAL